MSERESKDNEMLQCLYQQIELFAREKGLRIYPLRGSVKYPWDDKLELELRDSASRLYLNVTLDMSTLEKIFITMNPKFQETKSYRDDLKKKLWETRIKFVMNYKFR